MNQPPDHDGPAAREGAPGSGEGVDAPTVTQATPGPDDPATEGGADRPQSADDEHNPDLENLGGKLRRGAQYAAIALTFTQIISLAQTIVVARLLTPTEIGVFTLGTMFANFAVTVADGGMRAAVIQREENVADAADTAFWASLVTGTLMAFAALGVAPLLALFFDDRMVGLVCAATCGTLLIHSLVNVPEALLQRRFNFKRRLVVDPLTAGSFAVVTVVMVLAGFGVWGMVIGLYASQLATLISCWLLARWRPGRGRWSFRLWRELAGYSFPLIVSGLTDNIRNVAQQTLVGRGLDVAAAGQYRYGRRIGILPGQAIIQVASYVLFPAFARIASDIERFHHGFLRSLRMLWTATVPFAVMLVALGQPMIVVLLGEQWRPAGLFVAAMAGYGPGTAMSAIGFESIKGSGRSRRIHWLTVISLVVGLGGLVALIPFGLLGVGLAASLEGLVSGIASLALAMPLARATVRQVSGVLVPPLIAGAVAGVAVGLLEHTVVHADQRTLVVGLLAITGEAVLLLLLFVGVLYLIAPQSLRDVAAAVLRRRGRDGDGGEGPGEDGEDDGAERDDTPRGPDGGDRDPGRAGPAPPPDDAPTVVLALPYLEDATAWVLVRQAAGPRRPARPALPVAPGPRTTGVGLDAPTTALDPAPRAPAPPTPAPHPSEPDPPAPDGPAPDAPVSARRLVRVTPRPPGRPSPPDGPDPEGGP
ncbi:lipopolysaccharide biosynthesis protein [Actinomycetospora sp. CA-101289]|uniref:lipopolysaccharide biosynthesis protein n=1 Tax=Actinomycetospora sp. CA-101289 TaxID=3239893 RepID=UPI003D959DDB